MDAIQSEAAIKAKPGTISNLTPIMVVAFGVLFSVMYRNPLLLTDPQMFSEDIFVYFNENRLFGASALIEPYAGYLQLCCRIIAFIVGFAPPHYAADLYAAFFVAVIFATSAAIYTSPIFTGWGKVLAALALVYSPTGSEVFFGMPYTQWIMSPLVALALYESPTSKGRASALIACFAMIGLSSPLVILAAPFVLWKLVTERSRYAYILCGIVVVVAIVQFPGIIARSSANPAAGSTIERAFAATSIFYSWLTGPDYPGRRLAGAISIPTAALALWYFWQNRHIAYKPLTYFIAYGGLVLVAGCLQVDAPLHANQFFFGARYFFPTVVLCVLSFIVIEQNSGRQAATFPIIAVLLGGIYADYVTDMNIHFTYRNWNQTAACVEQRSDCVTPMNPGNTGYVRVPSDSEIKKMTMSEKRRFLDNQRFQ